MPESHGRRRRAGLAVARRLARRSARRGPTARAPAMVGATAGRRRRVPAPCRRRRCAGRHERRPGAPPARSRERDQRAARQVRQLAQERPRAELPRDSRRLQERAAGGGARHAGIPARERGLGLAPAGAGDLVRLAGALPALRGGIPEDRVVAAVEARREGPRGGEIRVGLVAARGARARRRSTAGRSPPRRGPACRAGGRR